MEQNALTPDFSFLERVEASGPFNAVECFQCRKCTNGCPAYFEMDLFPDQIVRLAVLGRKDEVLKSRTIWICASCETCSTRCPNGVRIAELMDYFREFALKSGIAPALPRIAGFHEAFLENIRFAGRVFEGALLPVWWARTGQIGEKLRTRKEVKQAVGLLRKKRMSFGPRAIKGRSRVKEIIRSSKQEPGTES
jgi:heterodisulfide reductase subunit C